jgi:hypothetical protein
MKNFGPFSWRRLFAKRMTNTSVGYQISLCFVGPKKGVREVWLDLDEAVALHHELHKTINELQHIRGN